MRRAVRSPPPRPSTRTSRRAVKNGAHRRRAPSVGKLIAERGKAAKVEEVIFDRGGYLYHGRVKALADAAREAGLKF